MISPPVRDGWRQPPSAGNSMAALMLVALATLAAAVAVYWVASALSHKAYAGDAKPTPSPPRHWLLGNIPQFAAHQATGLHIDVLIGQWMKTLRSKVVEFRVPGTYSMFAFSDVDMLKDVLVTRNFKVRWGGGHWGDALAGVTCSARSRLWCYRAEGKRGAAAVAWLPRLCSPRALLAPCMTRA